MLLYGNMNCADCVKCRQELDTAKIPYDFRDIGESMEELKAFLKLRDTLPLFQAVKEAGKIGIPCMVTPDGTVSLEWEQYVKSGNA